jgi:aminoglycoside phosphotransferase (APT) family kinase protein
MTTTEAGPNAFSERNTREALELACRAVGLHAEGARLMRLGENAIYALADEPIVVRIARSPDALDDVRKEMRVARWLAANEFPAARLATQNGDDALVVADRHPVTFWDLIPEHADPADFVDLAHLLKRLHNLAPDDAVQLPAFDPFSRVAARLANAPAVADRDDIAYLTARYERLQAAFLEVSYAFPPGPVHGDAHVANLIRHQGGRVLMLDFEAFAYGPREWDLTITGARRDGFAWMSVEDYETFSRIYGYDILAWSGFRIFRAIRELTMTTWLMQLVDDPRAAAEFHRRVDDIRKDVYPRQWSAF